MQVIFAGGASGVGASCLAIQLAEQWFVVDAGVRVGAGGGAGADRKVDPLPDLSLLEGKDVRAIFVTHAHADHIGALPLVHQAFPTVPIYASRGTSLLMEVMLADALKIMTRRAVEEMELPLYPDNLVASMLTRVRPLPVGAAFTLPALPGITISASRAGHIAGAVSFGFEAADGSLVVSGDISSTPQRTVLGAVPPPVKRCDLLVLESTYGSRLHPNRQAEEARLAQAVAEGLARGHVLIPCFGLGRGQEILLLLQAAQEKGQVPDFPIYVDGLVRRVCDTYLLLPEALTPRLQRQIRKGYLPFRGANVTFVRDERERERILASSPACILSSSGMLTGGPSAWYAARLAANPDASILITGYQDEEAPGRKLLDLAEHRQSTLDVGGAQVEVHCQVAKYNLSAHADGGELAAYAAALNPRRVALVHGDDEARVALRSLLTNTEVALPTNGGSLSKEEKRASVSSRADAIETAAPLETLPTNIGAGAPFDYAHIEHVWRAVTQVPTLRIVTARELATIWYGEATEDTTASLRAVLAQDYEQRYFVRQHALEEAYRVRGQQEEAPGDFLSDLVGSVLLVTISLESAKPVICRAIEPGAAIRVQLPRGISQERVRFPFSSILEMLGPAPQEVLESPRLAPVYLSDLVKAARRIRRSFSAGDLAQACQEDALYSLGELCMMTGIDGQSIEERLALAKLLHRHPQLFVQQRSVFDGEGISLYGLAPEWREALETPAEQERPDQNWILSVIEQYLGSPPDLYRRSVDPDSGAVTLGFHFPAIAAERYLEALEAAAAEIGVSITIAAQPHQGELVKAAYDSLPPGLSVQATPSLYLDRCVVSLTCAGEATEEELAAAQSRFYEETGWYLEIKGASAATASDGTAARPIEPPSPHPQDHQPLRPQANQVNQHDAMLITQQLLGDLPDFYKAGLELATSTLVLRFHFPMVAQARYADLFTQLEARTGWQVRLHPTVHQEALVAKAHALLPFGLSSKGAPSIFHDRHVVSMHCLGEADEEALQDAHYRFLEETGWQLELLLPGQKAATVQHAQRMPQKEALALTHMLFNPVADFYRAGADATKGTLWIHFHFPDVARQRYQEQLAALAERTGWRVYLYPHVPEAALVNTASRLLPAGVSVSGKATVYHDRRKLSLSYSGPLSADTQAGIQHQFVAETGWQLDLRAAVELPTSAN